MIPSSPSSSSPTIAVTSGDPAGIGPEICLDLFQDAETLSVCTPLVFCDAPVMRERAELTGKPLPETVIPFAEWVKNTEKTEVPALIDFGGLSAGSVTPGTVNAATGQAAYDYIVGSIDAALEGRIDGVATGPIHKEALRAAGVPQPGHTEIFAERSKAVRACMMLTSPKITCSFATTHIGYRDVPGALSIERVLDVIQLTAEAMRRIRGREPHLVVNGLNPHAGEHGLFGGGEEEEIIQPAIDQARKEGIQIEGPLPPDTAFLPGRLANTDAFVCMYHDQGHIPLKMLAFDSAINTTLGLPIIRTSVDHGTALDIAGQGKADASSLFLAIQMAARLAGDATA